MNIILFEDLAQTVQTQLHEPTSLIHVVFIITPPLGFNYKTMVSDNVIVLIPVNEYNLYMLNMQIVHCYQFCGVEE